MNWLRTRLGWLHLLLAFCLSGCSPTQPFFIHEDGDLSHYLGVSTQITYPDSEYEPLPEAAQAHAPFTVESFTAEKRWELTLEETLSIALQNAHVLRSLGGRVFTPVGQVAGSPPEGITLNPDFTPTAYDVAIQESSNTGVEAALANFDAQLQSRMTWDRTDRPRNVDESVTNVFQRTIERDNMDYQTEISKRTPSGTQWFFRNRTIYDSNNDPFRVLPSDWFTSFEMEMRHPLLRNSGVGVNRIPVMLARINTDVAIADFEINMRNFVLEVEQAYWNLYFHYHEVDASRTGADSALQTWKQTKIRGENDLTGGDAASEAQARAQYFSFKSRLQTAFSNLLQQESRLRYLLGLAPTDGKLIQPTSQPSKARVEFDFNEINNEALIRSPELRRQKWRIKQQQLTLMAARNQLLPQFDAIALYRFLGFGDQLTRFGSRSGADFPAVNSYATDNLTQNDFGEWQLGFQYQMTIGYRAEMASVRNAQLEVRRAEKRLEDEELAVTTQVTMAVRRMSDNYRIAQSQYNTVKSYRDQVSATETGYELAGSVPLDVVLDAQSRLAQAEIDYFRALTEYNLAIAEVHHRKGSLLEFNGVMLAEGPWPDKAYFDAHRLARQRDGSYYLNYGASRPGVLSRGPVKQVGGSLPTGSMSKPTDSIIETQPVIEPASGSPSSLDAIINGINGDVDFGTYDSQPLATGRQTMSKPLVSTVESSSTPTLVPVPSGPASGSAPMATAPTVPSGEGSFFSEGDFGL